jgi:hypothetical protein
MHTESPHGAMRIACHVCKHAQGTANTDEHVSEEMPMPDASTVPRSCISTAISLTHVPSMPVAQVVYERVATS